ncbi:MAG: tetratricopeptide repeat protein [Gammaproteobacteria bacterium]|nr:tetratricopeptide repeat protein [Gammaproteobacteria bacterium]
MDLTKIMGLVRSHTGIDATTIGEYPFVYAINNGMQKYNYEDENTFIDFLINSDLALKEFIEEIVVPETWFFREHKAFDALLFELKKIQINLGDIPLRILCLPCSSGEEAYSIAIKMLEDQVSPDSFIIDAIDLSENNIIKANQGLYSANSFRGYSSEDILSRYFIKQNDHYEVSAEVKRLVNFSQGNLFDASVLNFKSYYDVVFCRNMFIYFNAEMKNKAYHKLNQVLKTGGIFFIGHSEAGIIPKQNYKASDIPGSFAYIKQHISNNTSLNNSAHKQALLKNKSTTKNKSITKNSDLRHKKLTSKAGVFTAGKVGTITDSKMKKVPPATISRPVKATLLKENFSQQDNEIAHKDFAVQNQLKIAQKLADRGDLDEALELANTIKNQVVSVDCFNLLGNIYSATGKLEEAQKLYKKALYIDTKNYQALLHLSLLMEKEGDLKNAELYRKRALKQQIKNG